MTCRERMQVLWLEIVGNTILCRMVRKSHSNLGGKTRIKCTAHVKIQGEKFQAEKIANVRVNYNNLDMFKEKQQAHCS